MCCSLSSLLLDFAKKRKIKLQIDGFQNLNRSILQAKILESLRYPKDVEIAKMLISRRKEIGLDLNHRDDNGMTAYDILVHDDFFAIQDAKRQKVLELLENENRKRCIILWGVFIFPPVISFFIFSHQPSYYLPILRVSIHISSFCT